MLALFQSTSSGALRYCRCDGNGSQLYSLVAPVQSGCDVLLDVPHAVVGQVTHQHLPPKVQDLVHHVPQPVEQIPLVPLRIREGGRESQPGTSGREDEGKKRQNEDKRGDETSLWWKSP